MIKNFSGPTDVDRAIVKDFEVRDVTLAAPDKPPTVGLCLMVKNGESCVPRLLANVGPHVTHVLVMLNDCTDRTEDEVRRYCDVNRKHLYVARSDPKRYPTCYLQDTALTYRDGISLSGEQFGGPFTEGPLLADWGSIRQDLWDSYRANYREVSGEQPDWWLLLDADDEVQDPEVIPGLCAELERQGMDAAMTPYYYDVAEDGTVREDCYRDRLVLNLPEIRWEGVVHEWLVGIRKRALLPDRLRVVDHRDSRGSGIRPPGRCFKVLYRHCRTVGWNAVHPRYLAYLAMEARGIMSPDFVVSVVELYLRRSEWPEERAWACAIAGEIREQQKNYRTASDWYRKAMDEFPGARAAYRLCRSLFMEQLWLECHEAFVRGAELSARVQLLDGKGTAHEEASRILAAVSLDKLGRSGEGLAVLAQVIDSRKGDPEVEKLAEAMRRNLEISRKEAINSLYGAAGSPPAEGKGSEGSPSDRDPMLGRKKAVSGKDTDRPGLPGLEGKLRVWTCWTGSHKVLLNGHFRPSLPRDMIDHSHNAVQRTPTGAYGEPGFCETCLDKVDVVLGAIEHQRIYHEAEPFLYSDVDVSFFGDDVAADLLRQLGEHDVAFQDDGPAGRCAGFFMVRPNDRTARFFRGVRDLMVERNTDDQACLNMVLEEDGCDLDHVLLDSSYFNLHNVAGRMWTPDEGKLIPESIPLVLRAFHANWTVGVENKLRLLGEVRAIVDARKMKKRREHCLDIDTVKSGGSSPRVEVSPPRSPSPAPPRRVPPQVATVLQFWEGDREQAMRLARLLADLEPGPRGRYLVMASQRGDFSFPGYGEAEEYLMEKFKVVRVPARVDDAKSYPGIAHDPWWSVVSRLADMFLAGMVPFHSFFTVEPDGCPMSRDYHERIVSTHEETLLAGKWVTGQRMRFGGMDHVNGSAVFEAHFVADHPSLGRCPRNAAWDIFHGPLLVPNTCHSVVIQNAYDLGGITEDQFRKLSMETAWLTSVHDGSHFRWARRVLLGEG